MIVYKSRRFAVRRYQYGGVWNCKHDWVTSLSVCNKSNAAYSCKGGTERFTESKRAVPHLIAHKVVSTIADVAKKRKRVDINVKSSQGPQSKKAFVDTGADINALIDGSGIVLD